jgi:glucose-1-phosphate thymidylyltransferase
VDQDVLIIFVDTLFDADLSVIRTAPADGIIWAKEVEDYQRYGVIVTDAAGYMKRIVEKPDTPISRLANIGLHYVKDWRALFAGIDHVRKQAAGKGGEYYLTDAFQHMVDNGRRIFTSSVAGWYDCGKVDTLLQTNQHLLETGRARQPADLGPGCTIVPPVYIEDGVTIRDSRIGPNVTIEAGSTITDSQVANTILGRDVRIARAKVRDSVIGDGEVVEGREVGKVVMDAGEIASAR